MIIQREKKLGKVLYRTRLMTCASVWFCCFLDTFDESMAFFWCRFVHNLKGDPV